MNPTGPTVPRNELPVIVVGASYEAMQIWRLQRRQQDARKARNSMSEPIIQVRRARRTYQSQAGPVHALADVNLDVAAGERVAIVGRSGCGKSTLLNLLGGLDRPSGGSVKVGGTELGNMREGALARWRRETVGIIFQFFQLLPTLTIGENVILPMELAKKGRPRQRREKALQLLDRVGLADLVDRFPKTLSGGEQQRVAIARALANDPKVVLADEPTGNLDSHTAGVVLDILWGLSDEGCTVIMVTHERTDKMPIDQVIRMSDGRFLDQPIEAAERLKAS
ncbi:MAG: ABC transporter ATP-binding protein [Planctomycetota bacterium]|nr:ABC transporter ATP-binding protein [Planctomycetota bacterium]